MIMFLAYVAIVLTLILTFQLMRIYQLSSELKGRNTGIATQKDNRSQGRFMLLFVIGFFAFLIWNVYAFKDSLLPIAASDVGVTSDNVFNFNWVIIFIVFFPTTFLLFYYPFKYYGKENRKAFYYPHNDKLELIWTIVPSIVLTVIIIYGLNLWGKMTGPAEKDALKIQLYAKQFDFTARYAGQDTVLGKSDYRLIDDATNPLGIDTTDPHGWDDVVVRGEFHIPVNQPVIFYCNAREVMHGMFLPHFREQINAVPGMTTSMHFIPTITTNEMRKLKHDSTFNYLLLCNRVCGGGHYNMQMNVIVDSPDDFHTWMLKQKPFLSRKVTLVSRQTIGIINQSIAKR